MRPSSTACVDANLVVRLLGPTQSPGILRQWDTWMASRTELAAPGLLRYEVVNALYQMTRRGLVQPDVAEAAIRAMNELPLTLHHEDVLHQRALDLAVRFSIRATYDAHYLALAEHLGCEFWTGDRSLYNSVTHHLTWVRLLVD